MRGFAILGSDAAPVIGTLASIANHSNKPNTAYRAMLCLSGINEAGVAEVRKLESSPDPNTRSAATRIVAMNRVRFVQPVQGGVLVQ